MDTNKKWTSLRIDKTNEIQHTTSKMTDALLPTVYRYTKILT
jgi:hypothetical protein